jgi:hypothetical protein
MLQTFTKNVNIFKPVLMFIPSTVCSPTEGAAYRNAVSSISGYKNPECVGVDKEKDLAGLTNALILTSLNSDHFNACGKTPYIQTTDFLHLKYFPTSGPLLCIKTTSTYIIQRTSLHADHCNSSGTLPYIRTTFPRIRTISLHQNHFTTCGPQHFPTFG